MYSWRSLRHSCVIVSRHTHEPTAYDGHSSYHISVNVIHTHELTVTPTNSLSHPRTHCVRLALFVSHISECHSHSRTYFHTHEPTAYTWRSLCHNHICDCVTSYPRTRYVCVYVNCYAHPRTHCVHLALFVTHTHELLPTQRGWSRHTHELTVYVYM